EVVLLSTGSIADFEFEWRRSNPNNPALTDTNGDIINDAILDPSVYADMSAGSYFVNGVKVTDGGLGCRTTPFRVDVLDLSSNPVIDFSFTPNSSCDPARPNGILIADARELDGTNTDDYSFIWAYNGGAFPAEISNPVDTNNNSTIDGALDGVYNLTITNTNTTGCSFTTNFDLVLNLNISLPNIIEVDRLNPFDCLGSGEAEVVSISIGGGPAITGASLASDFEFEWYNSSFPGTPRAETTPQLTGLQPGSYFVLVKNLETDCKSDPKEVQILDTNVVLPVVRITQTSLQISCDVNINTAELAATGDGQIEPDYIFTWYEGIDLSGLEIANTSTLTDIGAGSYSVSVLSNITGCENSGFFIVPDQAPLYTPVLSTSSEPLNLCIGEDGLVSVRIINFDAAYPFPYDVTTDLFFSGTPDLTGTPDIANVPSFTDSNGNNFPLNFAQGNLGIGEYTFRVFDNNTGCVAVATTQVADNRQFPVVDVVMENPLVNCDPARANGQLSATADGGKVQGYSFAWYAGAPISEPPPALALSDNNKLIGQTIGTYSVRVVRNATGCSTDATGAIADGTVSPPAPNAFVLQHRRNCLVPDGIVGANVNGITIDFLFNWYNGNAVTNSIDFSGPRYADRDIGFYTVTATDLNTGCISAPGTVEVVDFRLTPEVSFDVFPSRCLVPTGALELLVMNNFSIQEITWTQLTTGIQILGSTAIYDQPDGTYRVNVVSTDGCETEVEVVIPTEITSYNGISANGDGLNDFFEIDCIERFPNNNVKIFNRAGIKVYEADGYNNQDVIFRGV
ncbi:MAG TPA: gliding motility-associated C-terminal domain-containing protein, partial [Cyclobacteriaceae bacterium]|nr:gliding motility-associated C-terminal domain-containing protein [Cyclobacteriaceae bacterium]